MSVELFALAVAAKAMFSHGDLVGVLGTAIDGAVGNRADDLVRNLAARMREGGLPANHHVQKAGQTALRETLKLLVSAVAAEIGDKPPLWDALQRHLRAGTLTDRPLIHFRDFPEFEWLESLQALAEDERALEALHRRLPFDEASVIAALRSNAEAEQAGRCFDETLAAWIDEHMRQARSAGVPPANGPQIRAPSPACLADFLHNGFPLERGGRERVRPFQAWRLIFAEAAKTTPEVFNILVLRTLADLSGRAASALPNAQAFQQALSEPVAFIQTALGRIEATLREHGAKLDGLHDKSDSLLGKVAALPQTIQQAIDRSIQTYRPGALHQLNRRLIAATVHDPDEEAGEWLDNLVRLNLLEYDGQRFDWHDLLREYAAGKAEAAQIQAARDAHASYYAAVAQQSKALYQQGHGGIAQGLALFDREREQLEAAFAWLQTRREQAHTLLKLVGDGAYTGDLRFHPRQSIHWLEAQAQAARQLGNRQAEGAALGNLGRAYADLGETRKVIDHSEQCLAIAREIGDRRGEGNALNNLGNAYAHLGETRKAIDHHEQDLAIAREIGDRRGEGSTLGNLGIAYAHLGETRKAIDYFEQRLIIAREIGDRRGEGNALWNAALAYEVLGERDLALSHADLALAIYEAIEDPNAAKVRATLAEWRGPGGQTVL